MRVTKANVTRTCAVCERTLLMGEHTLRFSPDGEILHGPAVRPLERKT